MGNDVSHFNVSLTVRGKTTRTANSINNITFEGNGNVLIKFGQTRGTMGSDERNDGSDERNDGSDERNDGSYERNDGSDERNDGVIREERWVRRGERWGQTRGTMGSDAARTVAIVGFV